MRATTLRLREWVFLMFLLGCSDPRIDAVDGGPEQQLDGSPEVDHSVDAGPREGEPPPPWVRVLDDRGQPLEHVSVYDPADAQTLRISDAQGYLPLAVDPGTRLAAELVSGAGELWQGEGVVDGDRLIISLTASSLADPGLYDRSIGQHETWLEAGEVMVPDPELWFADLDAGSRSGGAPRRCVGDHLVVGEEAMALLPGARLRALYHYRVFATGDCPATRDALRDDPALLDSLEQASAAGFVFLLDPGEEHRELIPLEDAAGQPLGARDITLFNAPRQP